MENQNPPINNHEYKARRILVLGTSGTGKTTLATKLILTHPAPLVLIYDWQGAEIGKRVGASIAYTRPALAEILDRGDRLVSYYPGLDKRPKAERIADFDWFCGMAFDLAGQTPGRLLLVVDEGHELIDPWNIPENLGAVLSQGRRREMDSCIVARSANSLQTEARDQMTELYCFRLVDKNSLQYPRELGLDPDKVKALADLHLIYLNGKTGEQKELVLS